VHGDSELRVTPAWTRDDLVCKVEQQLREHPDQSCGRNEILFLAYGSGTVRHWRVRAPMSFARRFA
jgi:hypothetical protein